MKHNIIKTENYLLAIDDSEIKERDYCLADIGGFYSVVAYNRAFTKHYYKKITAHLPLNNSPVLEGVPLLPPLEDDDKEVWEQGLGAELQKLPYTKHLDDGQYNDGQLVGFEFGATWGYNKAKEKYKYTEEDLRKCWKACLDFNKPAGGDSGINLEDFIQSLQQPKMPVAFECEEIYCGYMEDEALMKPKTTTNPQDQTVLAGKYIY
jgi:hypothetical protein